MKTQRILNIMHILAWVVFIGLAIKAGSLMLSYFISLANEGAAKDLYQGMNLLPYKKHSIVHYTIIVSYRFLQFSIQAVIAYVVIKLSSNLNLARPFNELALKRMQNICLLLLILWAVFVAHNFHVGILQERTGIVADMLPSDFVYIAGIVYVFSLLFKRGLELQTEIDLTI